MNLEKPIVIAKDHIAQVKIVDAKGRRAANILAEYLYKITNANFDVSPTISVLPSVIFKENEELSSDGFSYYIYDKDIFFEASSDKGFVYAVYDFLERIIGCRYYTSRTEFVPFDANLSVKFENYSFASVLGYREAFYKDFENEAFAEKHKMSTSGKHEGWGFWCHSFEKLISPEEYFDKHPEYFSLYNGIRVGKNAQLCLTNPDVFNLLVKNLRKHIEENPAALYWSVSQNDNNAYCQCDACQKINEREGSPMGTVLDFVNRVAEEFPDKMISTLAYWYTRKPPKTIRPAKNVHIMLCNIEANRGIPIEVDPASLDSKNELLEWKSICENVFLWDYCIQFRNLVSPFPNLRVIAPNIKFFVENNVRSLFSQANREYGGEFSELRGYMLAKLMWNPDCESDAIIKDFAEGYYKKASPYILEYIDTMHDALSKNGGELNIFGGPLDEIKTFLTLELFNTYEKLFDDAELSVAEDKEALFNVKTARLPLYYAGISLNYGSREKMFYMISQFAYQAKKIGLEKVEEWKITVDQFVTEEIAKLN